MKRRPLPHHNSLALLSLALGLSTVNPAQATPATPPSQPICPSLLSTPSASRSPTREQQVSLQKKIHSLRELGATTLTRPKAREFFSTVLTRYENFIHGIGLNRAKENHRADLESIHQSLLRLMQKPQIKLAGNELAQTQPLLARIESSLHHLNPEQQGMLTPDEWTLLAYDAAYTLTLYLEDFPPSKPSPAVLGALIGDRIENLLLPPLITTQALSIADINESIVFGALSAGLVDRIVYIDGVPEGETPFSFLFDHDLTFHGTSIRDALFTQFDALFKKNGYRGDPKTPGGLTSTRLTAPIHGRQVQADLSLELLGDWLDQIQIRLSFLNAVHARTATLSGPERHAVEVLLFFVQHEHPLSIVKAPQPFSYRAFLQASAIELKVQSIQEEIIMRIRRPNDLGTESRIFSESSRQDQARWLEKAADLLDEAERSLQIPDAR